MDKSCSDSHLRALLTASGLALRRDVVILRALLTASGLALRRDVVILRALLTASGLALRRDSTQIKQPNRVRN